MSSLPGSRHARFEREAIRPFRLTPRDRVMLEAVARHRLLSSVHLTLLAGGSRQQILRRLQLLFHHGYLDRPRAQLAWYASGSCPFVYALGREGAQAIGARRSRWTQKNRELGRGFLEHTLAVADFLVRTELSCRETPGVEFIGEEAIRMALPRPPESRKHPFRMRVAFEIKRRRERLGVIPDAVFGVRYANRPPGRDTDYFFLEIDRGTMPISRRSMEQTSLGRKFLAYHAAWKAGLPKKLFGLRNLRVLVATTTPARVQRMSLSLARAFRPSELALFVLRARSPGAFGVPIQDSQTTSAASLGDGLSPRTSYASETIRPLQYLENQEAAPTC